MKGFTSGCYPKLVSGASKKGFTLNRIVSRRLNHRHFGVCRPAQIYAGSPQNEDCCCAGVFGKVVRRTIRLLYGKRSLSSQYGLAGYHSSGGAILFFFYAGRRVQRSRRTKNGSGLPILYAYGAHSVPHYGHLINTRQCIGGTPELGAVCRALGGVQDATYDYRFYLPSAKK